jgi:hypothetical protein
LGRELKFVEKFTKMSRSGRNAIPKHQDLNESVRVMIDGHSGMKASGRNGGHSSRINPYICRLRNETVSCGGFGERIRHFLTCAVLVSKSRGPVW